MEIRGDSRSSEDVANAWAWGQFSGGRRLLELPTTALPGSARRWGQPAWLRGAPCHAVGRVPQQLLRGDRSPGEM